MNKGKALLGVLAGVAAGAALGILFAPDKGENTRKNIARKGDDLADAINDQIEKKFDQMMDAIMSKAGKGTPKNSGEETTKS